MNKDIGAVLGNHFLEMLRIHYTQPKKFLEKFQCLADMRTYTKCDLVRVVNFIGFTKPRHVASSDIE